MLSYGRFYSNDPVGFRDVHSFNRYAYANNNPYKYTVPDGQAAESYLNRPGGVSVGQHRAVMSKAGSMAVSRHSGVMLSKVAVEIASVLNESANSPDINPADVAGKTPDEIEGVAKEHGLEAKGPDPKNGKGAYVDPLTGKQRILIHPNADCGSHCHVNDADGNRLDIDGNVVPPVSPSTR